jgi:hypothetical protein
MLATILLNIGRAAMYGLPVPKFLEISANLSSISFEGKYGSNLPVLKL